MPFRGSNQDRLVTTLDRPCQPTSPAHRKWAAQRHSAAARMASRFWPVSRRRDQPAPRPRLPCSAIESCRVWVRVSPLYPGHKPAPRPTSNAELLSGFLRCPARPGLDRGGTDRGRIRFGRQHFRRCRRAGRASKSYGRQCAAPGSSAGGRPRPIPALLPCGQPEDKLGGAPPWAERGPGG
jgi:hypothetical protein